MAEKAAEMVKIAYTSSATQPLYTVRDILEKNDQERLTIGKIIEPTRTGENHSARNDYLLSDLILFYIEIRG